mgnify:CR=1 FL=1
MKNGHITKTSMDPGKEEHISLSGGGGERMPQPFVAKVPSVFQERFNR